MSEELKLIMKQNSANYKLLQCVLYYLGIKEEDLKDILTDIKKEVEEEFKDYE